MSQTNQTVRVVFVDICRPTEVHRANNSKQTEGWLTIYLSDLKEVSYPSTTILKVEIERDPRY